MTDYLFQPPAPVGVAITGTDTLFPVRRVYCVGRNYAAHAREQGSDPDREPPFFFSKDSDAIVPDGATIPYAPLTSNYHHEVELVVAIGKAGFLVPAAKARDLIYGYAVGFDMTRRDLQFAARDIGRPWDFGKNFPTGAPIGPIHPAHTVGRMDKGEIALEVNGAPRQKGDLSELIWSIEEVIEHLSRAYRLLPGDLIYTGTPAGVGPVAAGDVMVGRIEGLGTLTITVGPAEQA